MQIEQSREFDEKYIFFNFLSASACELIEFPSEKFNFPQTNRKPCHAPKKKCVKQKVQRARSNHTMS